MPTLTIHLKNKRQIKVVNAFLKALKIPFETSQKSPYHALFVAKIKESEQQAIEGEVTAIKTEDLWN